MNAQRFRLVFNRSRGILMAVAECVSARCKSAGSRSSLLSHPAMARWAPLAFAVFSALGGSWVTMSIAHAQVVAYRNAPASQQPSITNVGNGVPLINIRTPSAAGVSRNTYEQFDVLAQGAILNNSRVNTQTQLGGWVQGNPWLAAGTARVILNEIISANPSQLLGFIEVAGSTAQVVIANPAGLTCNGCGFINASRATLTTGTPILNGGNLDGYRVEEGVVRIEGGGMDASRVGYTDIIARAVQINAGLWAQTLAVTTGSNTVDANNTQVTPIAGSGAAPDFAIDVAQLASCWLPPTPPRCAAATSRAAPASASVSGRVVASPSPPPPAGAKARPTATI
jgi:filamentous hemagglutinin